MIVISSSIPKSGSTLVYKYQQDLLALTSQNNAVAQEEFKNYSIMNDSDLLLCEREFKNILKDMNYGI